MRLTRVAIDGDAVIDLHPRMTVVRGLGPDARQRLVDAFIGLPDGITRGVSGWVELDGVRRDLGAVVFEGLAAEDTKLVVGAGDLPGSDPALHRVSSRRADLGYERDRLLERLESARARVREATEECGRTLREWQVVHGGLPEVGADGDVVLEPAARAGPGRPAEEAVDAREVIQTRIDEIDRALLPLDPMEPGSVLAALEVATSPVTAIDGDVTEGEPVEPAAREGAPTDPFSSTGEDLFVRNPFAEAQPARPEPAAGGHGAAAFEEDPDPVVVAGRLRVAEARRTLAARQAAQRNALNRSELVEALEAAHAEVVEAHHRDRFGRSRSKVDEARAAEQHLLEQLGFPSYTAFVLSAGAIRSGDESEELTEAQAALAAAEAELARIVAERAALQAADDAPPAEEERRWEETPDASAELRVALAEVGLVLEDVTTDAPTLVALAHSWLAEQESALERRDALLAERADLVEQLAALPDPNEVEEALSEVAALARAEAELLGAEAEVSGITTRLEEIAEANKALMAEEADGRQEPEDVEEQAAMSVEQRVDDVTWYLSTRLAALRAGGDELILPILLDDPFVDFERDHAISLLASVEPFGGAVQIVLVTDDPALLEWAEALGSDRAWVVGAGR